MKRKYLYLTIIFLLGLNLPAPAQSEPDQEAFEGLQAALNKMMDDAESYESLKQMYDEKIRIVSLFGTDIVMDMNAEFKGVTELYRAPMIIFHISDRESDLHAEFDWQNMATSMRVKSSESLTGVAVDVAGTFIDYSNTQKGDKVTMFIDSLGYWYTPYQRGDAHAGYIRTNLMGKMQNMVKMLEVSLEAAIDAKVNETLDQLILVISKSLDLGEWTGDAISKEMMSVISDPNKSVMDLSPLLEELAKLQFEQISFFPPLIHFAYIFSPTLARSYNMQEQTITWRGQEHCIKMTNDEGYQIIFDRYGRLIHLKDTDGATADYRYDKDVTVEIPSSVGWGNFKPKKSPRPRREGAVLKVD
jgi:hypothetical protein